ncbi:MAG: elongation factor 4, partial [Actinomycetia bacterium]|nr:elongation factor 4 [Actinomycetes bacterium]
KGYKEPKSMVYSGLYPIEGGEYEKLRDALSKLRLNDPSFIYSPETSKALGFGFRCGFLGLLHMDIIRERLEREYDLNLLITAPSVAYRLVKESGEEIEISNPSETSMHRQEKILEPFVSLKILAPSEYLGTIMDLVKDRRGEYREMIYLSEKRVELFYEIPLAEIIFDFFNQLKARTRGYASLDYEYIGYREGDLVKIDILIAGEPVDALTLIIHKNKAYQRGKELIHKLRKIIPRQFYEVPLQAAIGSKIISRETIKAKRKDVLAKCYGGDVTRKRKLLERQKEGKKRLKKLGKIEIPQEAFIEIMKVEED